MEEHDTVNGDGITYGKAMRTLINVHVDPENPMRLASCTASNKLLCRYSGMPHYSMAGMDEVMEWNTIQRMIAVFKAQYPEYAQCDVVANAEDALKRIEDGGEDVDFAAITRGFEEESFRIRQPGGSIEDYRREDSPYRDHSGSGMLPTEVDHSGTVKVIPKDELMDKVLSLSYDQDEMYVADGSIKENDGFPFRILDDGGYEPDELHRQLSGQDIFWKPIRNPFGCPFRIDRDGTVDDMVMPAGSVFLVPTQATNELPKYSHVIIIDGSNHPDRPLGVGYVLMGDTGENPGRMLPYSWNTLKYAKEHYITYDEAVERLYDEEISDQLNPRNDDFDSMWL